MHIEHARSTLRKLAGGAAIAAAVGGAGCLAGMFTSGDQLYRSYLPAFIYFWGVSLGALAVLMIHHLVGGRWGDVARRPLEAAAAPLVAMIVLALPIVFGAPALYPWAGGSSQHSPLAAAEHSASSHSASHRAEPPTLSEHDVEIAQKINFKDWYLNLGRFRLRSAIYLACWAALAILLIRWSLASDDPQQRESMAERLQRLSGPGVVLYFLTVSLAAVDWMMSLDPHWLSAVYGILVMAGQGVAAFAFAVIVACWLKQRCAADVIEDEQLHDLGKLLLAAVSFWMYITFCQYLIIYSGNLPEEIVWYVRRSEDPWPWVARILIAGHFVIPFALLLSRELKRRAVPLGALAAWLLAFHLLDTYWLIMPEYPAGLRRLHWLDAAALLFVGGVWLSVTAQWLGRHPLFPSMLAEKESP